MTPPAYIIRRAVAGDRDALHRLICDHAQFERSVASLSHAALGELIVADPAPIEIFVAAGQERLLGYGALTCDYSLWLARKWAHLDCLFVHEDYRGKAIGSALLMAAIDIARAAGTDRLEWQTPSWNAPAIAFYEAHDAEATPKIRFAISL